MAGSVNKVIILGNLGADPELKALPSGQSVCEMRIATSSEYKDKNDQNQQKTEWHRIVIWGKQGENCAKYLKKGQQAYIEGRLQTRSWENKEGVKQYTTEIVADQVVFLSSRGGGEEAHMGAPVSSTHSSGKGRTGTNASDDFAQDSFPSDDDIPF